MCNIAEQNFQLRVGKFLAVKSNTQRSKHDEFYLVGFVQVRNSHVFRL